MEDKVVISASFGKDSTAMIHLMLEHNEPIHEVVYFESEWDFPQMEDHIALVEKNTGIKTVRVRYYRHFNELFGRYGWPHSAGGWCVARKTRVCNQFIRGSKGTVECIGFTTDEIKRTQRPELAKKKWKVRYPLIEYGFSEADALVYCMNLGYVWDGLYEVFNRVSCFCCPKAGKKRIRQLKEHFPSLYQRYLDMDAIAKQATRVE